MGLYRDGGYCRFELRRLSSTSATAGVAQETFALIASRMSNLNSCRPLSQLQQVMLASRMLVPAEGKWRGKPVTIRDGSITSHLPCFCLMVVDSSPPNRKKCPMLGTGLDRIRSRQSTWHQAHSRMVSPGR